MQAGLLFLFLVGMLVLMPGTFAQSNSSAIPAPLGFTSSSPSSDDSDADRAKKDLDSCNIHEVKSLPGSHQFGSDFIEAMASDPDPWAKDRNVVWALTADLSSKVPSQDQAMYISKSTNGGKTWTQVARVDSKYFDADIGEGERNGLGVSPGGTEFVITTQRGAFQVLPQPGASDAVVKSIVGPRVPQPDPMVIIPKRKGDPVTAGVVKITADGKHMMVGYGYFDLDPQIFTYRKRRDGSWIQDGTLPRLPTQMDILSMQFGDPRTPGPSSLYVGTGDQAFRLKAHAMQWTRIDGVGDDSAVQSLGNCRGAPRWTERFPPRRSRHFLRCSHTSNQPGLCYPHTSSGYQPTSSAVDTQSCHLLIDRCYSPLSEQENYWAHPNSGRPDVDHVLPRAA
jgi:hypothetical protein